MRTPQHLPREPVSFAGYIPALDGWRAIAILLVLFSHGSPWEKRLPFYSGSSGVSIFFVLSGFLITNRLLRVYIHEGRVSFGKFYYGRAFRILPPVFAYLLTLWVLVMALPMFPVTRSEIAAALLFFRNYFLQFPLFGTLTGWFTGHFWSLAVEEHYYLLWPLALQMAGKRKALWVALASASACVFWRAAVLHFRPDLVYTTPLHVIFYYRTENRLDGLLTGSIAALLLAEPARLAMVRTSIRSRDSIMFLLFLALVWITAGYSFLGVREELVVAALLLSTVLYPDAWLARGLSWPPLTWVGKLSYSLYIWQQMFLLSQVGAAPLGGLNRFPFNFLMLFAVAAFSYYCVEQPARRLGAALYVRMHVARRREYAPALLHQRIG